MTGHGADKGFGEKKQKGFALAFYVVPFEIALGGDFLQLAGETYPHNVHIYRLFSFVENVLASHNREEGQTYDNIDFPANATYGQASADADITTSFTILLAIFFPSVTG